MSKSKIYTRTGDQGETGLVSGTRISKGDARIELYGQVDELNSRIGLLVTKLKALKGLEHEMSLLEEIQSSLFNLGSNLACEADKRHEWNLPQLSEALILKIEATIDAMDAQLEPLKNFILPGGTETGAITHLCRTESRNVERLLVAYGHQSKEQLPALSLEFLNRLSDYFFVLARWINKRQGVGETQWKAR